MSKLSAVLQIVLVKPLLHFAIMAKVESPMRRLSVDHEICADRANFSIIDEVRMQLQSVSRSWVNFRAKFQVKIQQIKENMTVECRLISGQLHQNLQGGSEA